MSLRRRIAILGAALAVPLGFAVSSAVPAHAAACPNPDYPCDPVPPHLPPKVGVPKVTFGCGTVTVSSGEVSVTLPILPCPGPVIA